MFQQSIKMAKKQTKSADLSSEEKIIAAARKVFTKKGYAATRTRDIAEEAGMNLALLNYYYRSKEKLFQLVMTEKMQQLFGVIAPIVTNNEIKLETKIEQLADKYIDMLSANPDLPLFVLSEIKQNPEQFKKRMQLEKLIRNSSLMQQLKEKRPDIDPIHFLVNILGMLVFPFIARPIIFGVDTENQDKFLSFIQQRKKLIPTWVKAMLTRK